MNSLRAFDTNTARLVARLPKNLQRPFELLGWAAAPPVWGAVIAVIILFQLPQGIAMSVAVFLCMPIATVIKFAFRRQRPPTIYAGNMRIKSYSFPSSHAYAAALGSGYLAYIAWINDLLVLAILAMFLALTIGISRIYLGAHYPSDVIGGWLLGSGVLGVIILCL